VEVEWEEALIKSNLAKNLAASERKAAFLLPLMWLFLFVIYYIRNYN
jgi:hypothetical protein